jgi:hypothetical protein
MRAKSRNFAQAKIGCRSGFQNGLIEFQDAVFVGTESPPQI